VGLLSVTKFGLDRYSGMGTSRFQRQKIWSKLQYYSHVVQKPHIDTYFHSTFFDCLLAYCQVL